MDLHAIAALPVMVVTASFLIMATVRIVNGERTIEAICRRTRAFDICGFLSCVFCTAVVSFAETRPYMRLLLAGGTILVVLIVGGRELFKRRKPPPDRSGLTSFARTAESGVQPQFVPLRHGDAA